MVFTLNNIYRLFIMYLFINILELSYDKQVLKKSQKNKLLIPYQKIVLFYKFYF